MHNLRLSSFSKYDLRIQNIVADMRKVLSKHPQVEQQRLHRRAFFDNVDPENQALLVSFLAGNFQK